LTPPSGVRGGSFSRQTCRLAILAPRLDHPPPDSFNGPEGGKSLFSFNRTGGSCWRCKPVCRVKASIPGAIWATPPAPLPHRVRGHPRLQHRQQPKFASSITRLGESAAIGHSPRGVFLTGQSFPVELHYEADDAAAELANARPGWSSCRRFRCSRRPKLSNSRGYEGEGLTLP